MPSVDVIVPCYQQGRFLRECVASALSQDIESVRVIIIDNASTDETADVARALSQEDARVEVVTHEHNLGPHASFNEGIDLARADYMMVLCADDLLSPGSLRRAVSVMEQNPDIVFTHGTDVHWIAGETQPPLPEVPEGEWQVQTGHQFIRERCGTPEHALACGMVLVRTSLQKVAGYYRPSLPHTDDFELMLRLACLGSVAYTPGVLGIKRIHGSNRYQETLEERWRTIPEIHAAVESFFDNEGKSLPDAKQLRRLAQRRLSERAYWCGVKALIRGRKESANFLKLAVRLEPSAALIPPVGYLTRFNWSSLSFRD